MNELRLMTLVVVFAIAGCGGGSDPVTPQPPASSPPTGIAGLYRSTDSLKGAGTLIVDEEGRMIATAEAAIYHPQRTMLQRTDFSGTAVSTGASQWEIADALTYVQGTSDPAAGEVTRTAQRGRVTGTLVSGQSVSFSVSKPPALQYFPDNIALRLVGDLAGAPTGPLTMAELVGDYQNFGYCTSNCTTRFVFSIAPTGKVTGELFEPNGGGTCALDAMAVVADANRRVLRAQGTLAGANCPAGQTVLLGSVARSPEPSTGRSITWYFVDSQGRVAWSTHGRP